MVVLFLKTNDVRHNILLSDDISYPQPDEPINAVVCSSKQIRFNLLSIDRFGRVG